MRDDKSSKLCLPPPVRPQGCFFVVTDIGGGRHHFERPISLPSINIDLDFLEHPKTRRLVATLGSGSEIYLIRLWLYLAKFHCETGTFSGYTDPEIECLVHWTGEPQAMLQAMLKVGYLEKTDQGWHAHDWLDWEGHQLVYRQKAKKMAAARWNHASSNASSIPSSNAYEHPSNACSNANAVQGSAVQGNALQGREVQAGAPRYQNGQNQNKLSSTERISLEKERDDLMGRRKVLKNQDFRNDVERAEVKRLTDRIDKISTALFIPL